MYGFKSYFWFAFKLWLIYNLASIVGDTIVHSRIMIGLAIDSNILVALIVGWFFWRSKFKSQIKEEKEKERRVE